MGSTHGSVPCIAPRIARELVRIKRLIGAEGIGVQGCEVVDSDEIFGHRLPITVVFDMGLEGEPVILWPIRRARLSESSGSGVHVMHSLRVGDCLSASKAYFDRR